MGALRKVPRPPPTDAERRDRRLAAILLSQPRRPRAEAPPADAPRSIRPRPAL